MMGAGKTTVGAELAGRLGWAHLDSDAEIIRRTGRSVPQIWREQGEAAFRAEEARVLADAVGSPDAAVVSVAGGAVLDPANRALLRRSGPVVWLRATPATLSRRVGDGAGRPLLAPDPAAAIISLERARRPAYEEVATLTVDVDDREAPDVVEQIVAVLGLDGGAGE